MCNIVCAMCGLMSDNYLAWEEHVAEVALKEDSDHASLLAVKINSNGDKVNNKLPTSLVILRLPITHYRSPRRAFKRASSKNGHVQNVVDSLRLSRRGMTIG